MMQKIDPTLQHFMYCKAVQQDTDGSMNVQGVLNNLIPLYVPGAFSFAICFSILGINIEKPHNLRIRFMNDTKGIVLVDSNEISVSILNREKNSIRFPPEFEGLVMTMTFNNVEIENEGIYSTHIMVDGFELPPAITYVKGKKNL